MEVALLPMSLTFHMISDNAITSAICSPLLVASVHVLAQINIPQVSLYNGKLNIWRYATVAIEIGALI